MTEAPAPRPTPTGTFTTLNGFDEIAISKAFGQDIAVLQRTVPLTYHRALVFALKRREGLKDPDAKKAALELTIRELDDFFDADAPDADLTEDADPNA